MDVKVVYRNEMNVRFLCLFYFSFKQMIVFCENVKKKKKKIPARINKFIFILKEINIKFIEILKKTTTFFTPQKVLLIRHLLDTSLTIF